MLANILFGGQVYVYHEYDKAVNIGSMFGFVTNKDGNVAVANRIFETQLYDYFLADETRKNDQQREALPVTNQFIVNGQLDMDLVMIKFYEYYTGLGTGNFYVED